MERLEFTTEINAAVEVVFNAMLAPETYRQWTSAFSATSDYEGSWAQGSKIMFTMRNKEGKREGMSGIIEEYVPNRLVSIRFVGVLDGDDEITEGEVVDSFVGNYENYYFEKHDLGTSLTVEVDVDDSYRSYMLETYPRALEKLKQIAENHEEI